ncbi:MAG: carbon starvation protein A [Candidatus Omnitrophica bacterium]|nr:carbon starvation protein A [Candidatus Omnitrophota bacterium]
MDLLLFLLVSFVILFVAYKVVGQWLVRVFSLSTEETTPAHELRDGLDYEPARMSYLLPQHFSAIAAAGPIVGPILAGTYFGWGPAWLWILVGSILIGGIHDFTALVSSVRHRGQSVAQLVREYMNPRAYMLFLIFIWFALIYVVIAFTDVTAGTFVQKGSSAEAEAPGPAVATSSVLYLLLAVAMGLCLRFTKLGPLRAKLIFLPLVGVAILIGPYIPVDLEKLLPADWNAQQVWGYVLLAYCFLAAMAPVWSLLQPRGELGGYFLYLVMLFGVLGIGIGALTGGLHIEQSFFKGWNAKDSFGEAAPLLPILFITVACGACSGFHSIVASGTTSKQLRCEMDARPIGYGGMLLEGFFACISLATLMILSDPKGGPNLIYAQGIADFGNRVVSPLLPESVSLADVLFKFALLCFATFVFDTLDACTRLARYVLMELLGWKTRAQAALATLLSLGIPIYAVSLPRIEFGGKEVPLWQVFWGIFGSSNQLLAALTLLGVTVWLARKGKPYWFTLGPTLFMLLMSLWSLILTIRPYVVLRNSGAEISAIRHVQFLVCVSLVGLAAWLIVEAIITWQTMIRGGARRESLAEAG